MHLTNYSINKHSLKFSHTANACEGTVSHKRSVKEVYKYLEDQGHDVKKLKKEINKLIIKTLAVGQPFLAH